MKRRHTDARQPTWVYRLRCQHDSLLYVGIAADLERRLAQHAATKDWWPDVTFAEAELYPTRLTARRVEAFAIVYEHPKYNVQGVPRMPDQSVQPLGRRAYTSHPHGLMLDGYHGEQAGAI